MEDDNNYIRFDWAIKRILRDKANKGVLEGLMTVLIGQPITITNILESESNRDSKEDKSNRVDVKACTKDGEIIIVEVQLAREKHFMQRILFGTSKAIVEQIKKGQDYKHIKKVYSINVLYFDLGEGADYVYHGKTIFTGMNQPESVLKFNKRESEIVSDAAAVVSPKEAFPEYYLLRVNQFNEVAKTDIEEWMAYLKDGIIRPDTKTPGLQEAKEKLAYMRMSEKERHEYEEYMVSVHAYNDVIDTAKEEGLAKGLAEGRAKGLAEGRAKGLAEGRAEGRAEGEAKGRAEERAEVARKLKQSGVPLDIISSSTGLTADEIATL